MMSFVDTIMNPQLLATILAAVCVFTTVKTVTMPMRTGLLTGFSPYRFPPGGGVVCCSA